MRQRLVQVAGALVIAGASAIPAFAQTATPALDLSGLSNTLTTQMSNAAPVILVGVGLIVGVRFALKLAKKVTG
jgi:hypothetical protein